MTKPQESQPGDVSATREARAHMPPAAVPVVPQAAARADVAAAPPSQDFRFNEYSMFAAEPGSEQVWVEAGRQKTGSGRVALLLIVVAALDSQETRQQEGPGASGDQAGPAQQAPNETSGSNPGSGDMAPAESGRADGKVGERKTPEANSQASTVAKGTATGADLPGKKPFSAAAAAPTPAPKQPAKAGAPRSANTAGESEDARVGGHSILVNAPEPGSSPFVVNLQ